MSECLCVCVCECVCVSVCLCVGGSNHNRSFEGFVGSYLIDTPSSSGALVFAICMNWFFLLSARMIARISFLRLFSLSSASGGWTDGQMEWGLGVGVERVLWGRDGHTWRPIGTREAYKGSHGVVVFVGVDVIVVLD